MHTDINNINNDDMNNMNKCIQNFYYASQGNKNIIFFSLDNFIFLSFLKIRFLEIIWAVRT